MTERAVEITRRGVAEPSSVGRVFATCCISFCCSGVVCCPRLNSRSRITSGPNGSSVKNVSKNVSAGGSSADVSPATTHRSGTSQSSSRCRPKNSTRSPVLRLSRSIVHPEASAVATALRRTPSWSVPCSLSMARLLSLCISRAGIIRSYVEILFTAGSNVAASLPIRPSRVVTRARLTKAVDSRLASIRRRNEVFPLPLGPATYALSLRSRARSTDASASTRSTKRSPSASDAVRGRWLSCSIHTFYS